MRDGERVPLGDLTLEFLHTPGHTPEHICVLITGGGEAARLFTGDTLFVGAVGRPDLLGPEQMRTLAGELYDSLTGKILALDGCGGTSPGTRRRLALRRRTSVPTRSRRSGASG